MKHKFSPGSAAAHGLTSCENCGGLAPSTQSVCAGCGFDRHLRKPRSISNALALTTAAVAMIIPANIFPILISNTLGKSSSNTILGGVLALWEHGDAPLALVVFLASFVIPIGKILALYWLCYMVIKGGIGKRSSRRATVLYRVLEVVGRWSMVDVFVVAILVALIQLGPLMSIQPGPAALPFALAVVATMLAAITFDPRLIWDTAGIGDTDGADDE